MRVRVAGVRVRVQKIYPRVTRDNHYGYGTVQGCTNHVMSACCDKWFCWVVMQWPSDTEIKEAKEWVEANSCPAWREGWLMVDGTLIPMFQRPHHFGSAYFDCKSNYSENVQVSYGQPFVSR